MAPLLNLGWGRILGWVCYPVLPVALNLERHEKREGFQIEGYSMGSCTLQSSGLGLGTEQPRRALGKE